MKKYFLFYLLLTFAVACHSGSSSRSAGQVLRISNGSEAESLDPHLAQGFPESRIINELFEGLTRYDPKTLDPLPGVAKSWEISPDGLVYTFHLRDNAKWSDGTAVTARDFAYAWHRILTPELASVYAYMLYPVKNARAYNEGKIDRFEDVGLKVIDDFTFEVTLENPTAYFLKLMSFKTFMPLPQKVLEKYGALTARDNPWIRAGNMVSNGAFQLTHWVPNEKIVIERNPHYWDAGVVKLDAIEFYPIDNILTEEKMFRSGQIDSTYEFPMEKIEDYKKNDPTSLRIEPFLMSYFYVVNVTKPPLNDVRVRQALAWAIDRELLSTAVTKGTYRPGLSLTPAGTAGFTPQAPMGFDAARAQALLAEAGYPNGKGFPKISLLYNTSELHRSIAEAIQQMWKKNLNIAVELTNQEWKVYLNSLNQGNFDIARRAWIGDYDDPYTFVNMYETGNGMNNGGYSNPAYDALVQKSTTLQNQAERMRLFDEAEKILNADLPILPLFHASKTYALRKTVKGWYPTFLHIHPLREVYLEK